MEPDEKTVELIARAIMTAEGRDPDEMQFPSEHEDVPGVPAWEMTAGFARRLLVALDAIKQAEQPA